MNDSQIRELDMGQRVRQFAASRPTDFPAGTRAAVLLATIQDAITQTEQQAAKQTAANLDWQEQTEQKEVAINTLSEYLRAINRTARSINQQLPGIADQFKMPRGGDQAIINTARAYIIAATPIATEFTTRGFTATFLTDLQTAIDAADQAEDRQSAALGAQTAATAAISDHLKQLREAVRELDIIIRNKYRADPAALASWKSASHLERAPKRTRKPTPTPPPAD